MGYEAEPIEMAMLVLKTQTNLTNYGWEPSHAPQEKEHPLPEPHHHTQANLEDFGFDFPQDETEPPSINDKEELLSHMEGSAGELGLDGLEYWFNRNKIKNRRSGYGTWTNSENFKESLLEFKSEIFDAMQDLDTQKHSSFSDEEALLKYQQLLNQVKTLQDNPPETFNFNAPTKSVQTILGQHHPSLPGPYSDEPINMVRIVPNKLRSTSYTHPVSGRKRQIDDFDTRQSILSGGMPLASQTHGNKQFEMGLELRGGKQRVFPLGGGGSFYVPNTMSDLSNIATTSDMEQSTLWGLRGLKPQQIDAFMRGANESPENLNEILVREKIDPQRVVDLSTGPSMKHRGRPSISLEDMHQYQHMQKNPLAQIGALRGPGGKPLVTSTGETILDRINNRYKNIYDEEHDDYQASRSGVFDKILGEYEHLPKIKDTIERHMGSKSHVDKLRTLLDIAQQAGMSRFATSDVDLPMGEDFWPLNLQGEQMSLEELEGSKKPIERALDSLKNLHRNRRPPDWGEVGEEAVIQPPTTDEQSRLYASNLISDDDINSYTNSDSFHNMYSNVEAMDALRQMREEDAAN